MKIEAVISQALSGMSVGMGIFIIAAGLVFIFGTVRILNLAHGAMYMLGAFLCFWLVSILSHIPGSFWIAVLIAPLLVALVGFLIEVVLIRRMYEREMIYQLILTFGIVLVVSDFCKMVWGVEYNLISAPWPFEGATEFFGIIFPSYNLFLIVVGFVVFIALWMLLQVTQLGRLIRAIVFNSEMVSALGINVPRVYTFVFVLGCWLAGLGGALVAPTSVVTLGIDSTVLIECFIIAVIGGLGSLPGAFVGSIIFGMVNAFGILIAPQLAAGFAFIMMAVILLIRPYGLFGRPE